MKRAAISAALIAIMMTNPVYAQDASSDSGGDSDTETATLLAYLGLSAAEGKTTVGEKTGEVEGYMITSALALQAAVDIRSQIEKDGTNLPVVLAIGEEQINLQSYQLARARITILDSDVKKFERSLPASKCNLNQANNSSVVGMNENAQKAREKTSKPAFKIKASDILGLIRSDNALAAVPISLSGQLMKNAFQMTGGQSKLLIAADAASIDSNDPLISKLSRITRTVGRYSSGMCASIAGVSKDENTAIVKSANALEARIAALATGKDGAASLLEKALQSGAYAQEDGLRVLRVNVEKGGGTLINTSNIFTSLGVPGVTMRGGLVVSYRLTNPVTGQSDAAGVISCRFPMRVLRSLTDKPIPQDKAQCQSLSVPSPTGG